MPARTHGSKRGPLARTYRIWGNMKTRCRRSYSTLCERWQSFDNFLADMGPCPDGLTIERLNNRLGYTPGNCKWGSRTEQGRNTSRVRLSPEIAAEIRASAEGPTALAQRLGVHLSTIKHVRAGRTWRPQ